MLGLMVNTGWIGRHWDVKTAYSGEMNHEIHVEVPEYWNELSNLYVEHGYILLVQKGLIIWLKARSKDME